MAKSITFSGGYWDWNGGTTVDPVTMADAYAAEIAAGGWGILTCDAVSNVYTVDASVFTQWRIGNLAATYALSSNETVVVLFHGRTVNRTVLRVNSGSELQLGLTDGVFSYEGAVWRWNIHPTYWTEVSTTGVIKLYASVWAPSDRSFSYSLSLVGNGPLSFVDSSVSFREARTLPATWLRSTFLGGLSGPAVGHSVADTLIVDTYWGLPIGYLGGDDPTIVRGVTVRRARNNTWYAYNSTRAVDAIDCAGINWAVPAGGPRNVIREQHAVNLVTDAGATMTILDNGGVQIAQANANGSGVVAEQIVTATTYDWSTGSLVQTDHGPHTIRIEMADYQTYEWTGMIDEALDWRISLAIWPTEPTEAHAVAGLSYFEGTRRGRFVGTEHFLDARVSSVEATVPAAPSVLVASAPLVIVPDAPEAVIPTPAEANAP